MDDADGADAAAPAAPLAQQRPSLFDEQLANLERNESNALTSVTPLPPEESS
jgi:hypothetical protein